MGAGLLQDVIARTLALGEEIGCRGLLVHAETTEARDLYRHVVPELEESRGFGHGEYLFLAEVHAVDLPGVLLGGNLGTHCRAGC